MNYNHLFPYLGNPNIYPVRDDIQDLPTKNKPRTEQNLANPGYSSPVPRGIQCRHLQR